MHLQTWKENKNYLTTSTTTSLWLVSWLTVLSQVQVRSGVLRSLSWRYPIAYLSSLNHQAKLDKAFDCSGVARAFPSRCRLPQKTKMRKKMKKIWGKNEREYRKMRKDWGNILISYGGGEGLRGWPCLTVINTNIFKEFAILENE